MFHSLPARRSVLVIVLVLSSGVVALKAQAPNPGRGRGGPGAAPAVVSPEVHPDRRVTFRLLAPKATEVRVQGEFGEAAALTRDAAGIWTATVGPVAPGAYQYSFSADGVTIVDARNKSIVQNNTGIRSLVVVSGGDDDLMSERAVPHGAVRRVHYRSASLAMDRRMHIYTPPGYDQSSTPYPVLYLLHGAGGSDNEWSTVGRAGFILDNLIAAGRAKPMVVVMPDGHVAGMNARDTMTASPANDKFTDDLLRDIVPYVEKQLRVSRRPQDRAIAGLSMGGVQTMNIGLTNLDKFSQIGVFSSGWFPDVVSEVEKTTVAQAAQPENKKRLKLLWLAVGTGDTAHANTKLAREMFDRHGITYAYHETDGGHTWINWRRYLLEFAPRLFR